MAGDLPIREQIIVIEPDSRTEDEQRSGSRELASTIEKTQARVLHHFGPRVLIVEGDEEVDETVRGQMSQGFYGSVEAIPSTITEGLDLTGRLGLQAFKLRQSEVYTTEKATRPLDGESWDTAAAQTPAPAPLPNQIENRGINGSIGAEEAVSLSGRLIGSVAIGIVIVEGPTPELQFSATDRQTVVAEVQNGLSWVASIGTNTNLSWHYNVDIVQIASAPGSGTDREALWRDPAMAQLGYGAGVQGVTNYVKNLQSRLHTNAAYCAFFTKYPLNHFAYVPFLNAPYLVMDYANDGWGVTNIDRVFVHETFHLFGAPDEYKSSQCNCGGRYGYYQVPNGNCNNCAAGGGVTCMMGANAWAICPHTWLHLGWPGRPIPLHRYWNPKIGDHFYTTAWSELGAGNQGWKYERTQGYAYANQQPGAYALYRYWNPKIGDHFYTTNWNELRWGNYGWAYEGVQCYVYRNKEIGTTPLYRYWNSKIGDHFYTTSWGELGSGKYGYRYEGVQCYVYPVPQSGANMASAPETFRLSNVLDIHEQEIPATFRLAPEMITLPLTDEPTQGELQEMVIQVPTSFQTDMDTQPERAGIPDTFRIVVGSPNGIREN